MRSGRASGARARSVGQTTLAGAQALLCKPPNLWVLQWNSPLLFLGAEVRAQERVVAVC